MNTNVRLHGAEAEAKERKEPKIYMKIIRTILENKQQQKNPQKRKYVQILYVYFLIRLEHFIFDEFVIFHSFFFFVRPVRFVVDAWDFGRIMHLKTLEIVQRTFHFNEFHCQVKWGFSVCVHLLVSHSFYFIKCHTNYVSIINNMHPHLESRWTVFLTHMLLFFSARMKRRNDFEMGKEKITH